MLEAIPFDPGTWAACAAVVFLAYVVFGITAFGAAMFAVPGLSLFFPLAFVLPVCVLLDVCAALVMGVRFSSGADRGELAWMAPASLLGAIAGVTLLVTVPQAFTIAVLGTFLAAWGLRSLLGPAPRAGIARHPWALIAGFGGGAAGTLFGVGAPPYAMYLSRRLVDPSTMRATLSNMVLLSTSIRTLVFAVGGLVLLDRVLGALLLLPFVLAGLAVGHRIQRGASRQRLLRAIAGLLVLIGVSLMMRGWRLAT